MADFHADQEQIEELKDWWSDNGSFVIAGLAVGILAVGGYWGWRNYTASQAEFASETYESLVEAVALSDRDRALELGRVLTDDYAGTPYAAHGGLALAKFHMESQEPEEASSRLQEVLDTSDDPLLTHVARLRLARIQLDQGRPEDALALLDGVEPGSFAPRYHEVRGDIHVQIGDLESARTEYISALATVEENVVDRPTVQMKLDDLTINVDPVTESEPAEPVEETGPES